MEKCWEKKQFFISGSLDTVNIMVKVNWSRYRPGVALKVGRGIALHFHDRGTRRGWVVSSTPRPQFTPGKDPVPILQEAGWAPGPVWTGGISRPHRDFILSCVSIGCYTSQGWQSLTHVQCWCLCIMLHSVSASIGESLRGGSDFKGCMEASQSTLYPDVTNPLQTGGGGRYSTSRYLPTVGFVVGRWYSFQQARFRKSM